MNLANSHPSDRSLLRGMLAGTAVVGCAFFVGSAIVAHASNATGATVTVRALAQASIKQLPPGKIFVSVLDFSQVPGAICGPGCHLPAAVYTLRGVATASVPGGRTVAIGQGEAAFTPALAVHGNDNVDGRIRAGAIGVGLILVAIFLCAATLLRGNARRVTVAGLSLVLIAGAALEISGATANDWYLIGIRPVVQRSQPMPRPDGRVVFSSSDVNPVPAGPYVESLSALTMAPGIRYQVVDVTGPETIIVMAGQAVVDTGGKAMRLGPGQAILAQAQSPLAFVNPGQDSLQLLDFAVRPNLSLALDSAP